MWSVSSGGNRSGSGDFADTVAARWWPGRAEEDGRSAPLGSPATAPLMWLIMAGELDGGRLRAGWAGPLLMADGT
jgi:hypothetical protein